MEKPDKSVTYHKNGRVAYITLNRPKYFNAIDYEMPKLLKECIEKANYDDEIRVILLTGAGNAFCSGYDLKLFAENPRPCPGSQTMPWDPLKDYQLMGYNTECFMSIWRSLKPVICKIKGVAVGGGSDIALCCDQIFATDNSRIGYPPARIWGVPTTFMWVYRLGLEKAKNFLMRGKLISGKQASDIGLISQSFKTEEELETYVTSFIEDLSSIPSNQLMMIKMTINQAYENMGMRSTQIMATLFDGIARHTPEGIEFKNKCEKLGFKQAVIERDQDINHLLKDLKPKF
jgi:enoyl-CoA hydratase